MRLPRRAIAASLCAAAAIALTLVIARAPEDHPVGDPTPPAPTTQAAALVPGDIKARYEALGGEGSVLGPPADARTRVAGGYIQEFASGYLMWGPNTGAKVVSKKIGQRWLQNPVSFGWPVADAVVDDEGTHERFEVRSLLTKANGLTYDESVRADRSWSVVICDSQCDGNSWVEQGLRATGTPNVHKLGLGGGGYSAIASAARMSVTSAVVNEARYLPAGSPDRVVITLGGNDATQARPVADILASQRVLVQRVRELYPTSRIIVNGVMSRNTGDHAQRRAVDALVTAEARRLDLPAISLAGWGTLYGAQYKDSVHLTQAGHNTIALRYAQALRRGGL